jgi:hypothetical protein
MRRLAIRSVLSGKAADGQIVIVDSFEELEPRTKAMVEVMGKLNVGENSALIMTPGRVENLEKAASNLPKVTTMSAHLLSVVDMLKHDFVVIPRASLDIVNRILGNGGGRTKLALRGSTVASNGATAEETSTKGKAPKASAPSSTAEVEETAKPAPRSRRSSAAGTAKATAKATAASATPSAADIAPPVASAANAEEAETIVFAPSEVIRETAAATIEDTDETDDNAKAVEGEI